MISDDEPVPPTLEASSQPGSAWGAHQGGTDAECADPVSGVEPRVIEEVQSSLTSAAADKDSRWVEPPSLPAAHFDEDIVMSSYPPEQEKNRGTRRLHRRILVPLVAVIAGISGGLVGAGAVSLMSTATTSVTKTVSAVSLVGDVSNTTTAIVAKVEPAVVLVQGRDAGTIAEEGTGMIVTSSGEIVTNDHVIAGASSVTVVLSGTSTSVSATVVGTDVTDDIALLKIQGTDLPTVTFANSSSVAVGDGVVAIGYALGLSGDPTVTDGIVSAENRSITASDSNGESSEELTGLFQTDAAISSGDSGGPLVDSSGDVIGMDSASAASDASATAQNIGFAIPSNKLVAVIAELRTGATT